MKLMPFIISSLLLFAVAGCLSESPNDELISQPRENSGQVENITKGSSEPEPGEDSIVSFSWAPSDHEFVFILEIVAGKNATCNFDMRFEGTSANAESNLLHYSIRYNDTIDNPWLRSFVVWDDSTIHYGPVHTSPYQNIVHNVTGLGSSWSATGGASVANGTSKFLIATSGASIEDSELRVDCNGDAIIRHYSATDYAMVMSDTAEGGHGYSLPVLGSYNQGDAYSVETNEGFVLFDVFQMGLGGPLGESYARGNIHLDNPLGTEEVSFDVEGEESVWEFQRIWDSPGTYSFEFDRRAQEYWPLVGVLASFSLVEEIDPA